MSVQFTPQPTPNPNAYKFVASGKLNKGGPQSYTSAGQAASDEVARELFRIRGVVGVLILDEFCTVSQDGSQAWADLIPQIEAVLVQAYG